MKRMYSRREVLKTGSIASASLLFPFPTASFTPGPEMIRRKIPSSGQLLPVVGLGTWQTFDIGNSQEERLALTGVLENLYTYGGSVIDSSPMYGRSESVVGDLTEGLDFRNGLFYATKVWTQGEDAGMAQIKSSARKMKREVLDLVQVHNLLDHKTQIKTLRKMKEAGQIKYWGITHYLDSAHGRLEEVIKSDSPDFVQFNYSIRSRHAEKSLLETARKYNTAVLINQPFDSGSLFRMVKDKNLPPWCEALDIKSWGQYFLKFILSNEAVTCVIPGTSKPHHMADNAMAGHGALPDQNSRARMIAHLKTL